jgi:hypothetical protein
MWGTQDLLVGERSTDSFSSKGVGLGSVVVSGVWVEGLRSRGCGIPDLLVSEGLQAWTSSAGELSSFLGSVLGRGFGVEGGGSPGLLVGEGSYRQQDTGGHGQVIEQHSLRQRNGGQQDGRNGLPSIASQSIAGHFFPSLGA